MLVLFVIGVTSPERAGRVVVRARDGRGRGAAGAPHAAAAVPGGLPAADGGCARPPRALPQPRQVPLSSLISLSYEKNRIDRGV